MNFRQTNEHIVLRSCISMHRGSLQIYHFYQFKFLFCSLWWKFAEIFNRSTRNTLLQNIYIEAFRSACV